MKIAASIVIYVTKFASRITLHHWLRLWNAGRDGRRQKYVAEALQEALPLQL